MTYFKIGTTDISSWVNKLTITTIANYTSLVNAAGNTRVDYRNSKQQIEVGIIPLKGSDMATLKSLLAFNTQISFRNPDTLQLRTNVNCILPENAIDYYTIQNNNVSYNGVTLTFQEL